MVQPPSTRPSLIGPYTVLGILGKGGMGIVYRAIDTRSGALVAIKSLQQLSEAVLSSFRREIQWLARIDHPGVVRILDEGVHNGLPWYAMAFVSGKTLRLYAHSLADDHVDTVDMPLNVNSAPTLEEINTLGLGARTASGRLVDRTIVPPDLLHDLLAVVRRVCIPLAFLHGEGIVHRDLKPDNIIVPSTGRPVLVDFGVASFFAAGTGREELSQVRLPWGTVQYMAPEQIRGQVVDARADLYALGCILYELVTGAYPFPGDDAREIAQRHLTHVPAPPSHLVDGVPADLDRLIVRLLAKEPRDRLGFALDVAAALDEYATPEDREIGYARPRPYLYRPEMAGRTEPLEQVHRAIEALGENRGSILLISGESGVGKTRLALEAGRLASMSGIRVLTGEVEPRVVQADGDVVGTPLGMLKQPLRTIADLCTERGVDETRRLLGPRARVLASYEPDLGLLAGIDAYPEPDELPAEAARLRVYECLTETFVALADGSPVLLILDDLQWADELTLGFLRYLDYSEAHVSVPLFVLGTFRAEEVHGDLEELLARPDPTVLNLDRLDAEAIARTVSDMLALDRVPPSFGRFVFEQSEGNPFFVAQYLRAAVEQGLLHRDSNGEWTFPIPLGKLDSGEVSVPLPTTLRALVARRLRDLPVEAARLAAAASVTGREAPIELLARMVAPEDEDVGPALVELVRRQVLEEPRPGLVRFSHDKIRELAYERLDDESRRDWHLRAARNLEEMLDDLPTTAAVLGGHWESAGEIEPARRWYLAGARHARQLSAYGEAERLYRAYLELADEEDLETTSVRIEFGDEVLRGQGQGSEATDLLWQAVASARRAGDESLEGSALRALAATVLGLGRVREARDLYESVLGIARRTGNRHLEGEALSGLCLIDAEQGHLDEALALADDVIAIARDTDDLGMEARVTNNLASIHADQGRVAEATTLCERALELHRRTGNRRQEAISLGNLAVIKFRLNRLEEAIALNREAMALHRQIGNLRFEGITLVNLAVLEFSSGEPAKALELYDRAIKVLRRVGDRRTEGVVQTNVGSIYTDLGNAELARTHFDRAIAIHRDVENRRIEAITYGYLARLERNLGRTDEARRLVDRGLEMLEAIGDPIFDLVLKCERGHQMLARDEDARGLLDEIEARAEALEQEERDLTEAIERLRRAVTAREAGIALVRGTAPEDLPR